MKGEGGGLEQILTSGGGGGRDFPQPFSLNLFPSCVQTLSPLMGVRASYEVGLKSAQAWGCPFFIKCLRHMAGSLEVFYGGSGVLNR
jgi:hypothetical protein